MTRPGKMAGVLALLAALLLGSPALSRDPEDDKKTAQEQIRELRDELRQLKNDLKRLESNNRSEANRTADRLDRIERVLEKLADRMTARRSFSIDPDRVPLTSTGTIRLDNRMDVPAYVNIDGALYSVPPLGMRTIRDRSAGLISYQVRGLDTGWSRTRETEVRPNETLTITIR